MTYQTIILIIKENLNNIKKIMAAFMLFGFLYIFSSDVLYKSQISLYPAGELSDTDSIISEFVELSETFGVSVPSKSNYYIPDIVDSYSLKKEIVNKKWKSEKFQDDVNLIEYWEISDYSFIEKISRYIKLFFDRKYYNADLYNFNVAVKKLDKLISVDEAYSGLIEVEVLFNEPQLSADIANYISNYVVNFVNSEQKLFASKTKDFTEKRFKIAENDLIISENKLTEFRKEHPLLNDTPETQLLRLRLIRDLEVNQEVFITLRNQLEIAKIEEAKERLYINILDKAYPSIKKEHPKFLLLLLIFSFLGALFSFLFYIILYNVKKK